ncbi:MAG TPA: hypothetical protein PKD98_08355 [Anaerolineae bacterium]|nr:hypothetical protein [Anaerolineae bacterium]
MWKIKLILTLVLFIWGDMLSWAEPAQALRSQRTVAVSDLWLDVSLGPPLIDWFNEVARPSDIARVEHIEQLALLDNVTVGRKLVVFKSAAEAERFIPLIADQIDIVGYNLEHGPTNPLDEQEAPVESAKRMHELAEQYGLELAFGPDHRFALSDGVSIAPYVDIFVLQVQRAQTEPARVREFIEPLIPELRQANPDLQISVQVRTEGNVVAIVDLIDSFKEQLDGVSILTSPETVEVAEALVDELQTREVESPGRSNSTAAGQDEMLVSPDEVRPPLLSDNLGNGSPIVIEQGGLFWIFIAVSGLLAGLIGGGLVAFLICKKS